MTIVGSFFYFYFLGEINTSEKDTDTDSALDGSMPPDIVLDQTWEELFFNLTKAIGCWQNTIYI